MPIQLPIHIYERIIQFSLTNVDFLPPNKCTPSSPPTKTHTDQEEKAKPKSPESENHSEGSVASGYNAVHSSPYTYVGTPLLDSPVSPSPYTYQPPSPESASSFDPEAIHVISPGITKPKTVRTFIEREYIRALNYEVTNFRAVNRFFRSLLPLNEVNLNKNNVQVETFLARWFITQVVFPTITCHDDAEATGETIDDDKILFRPWCRPLKKQLQQAEMDWKTIDVSSSFMGPITALDLWYAILKLNRIPLFSEHDQLKIQNLETTAHDLVAFWEMPKINTTSDIQPNSYIMTRVSSSSDGAEYLLMNNKNEWIQLHLRLPFPPIYKHPDNPMQVQWLPRRQYVFHDMVTVAYRLGALIALSLHNETSNEINQQLKVIPCEICKHMFPVHIHSRVDIQTKDDGSVADSGFQSGQESDSDSQNQSLDTPNPSITISDDENDYEMNVPLPSPSKDHSNSCGSCLYLLDMFVHSLANATPPSMH